MERKILYFSIFILIALPLVNAACFTQVNTLPVSCAGTLTQDMFKGCRTTVCVNGSNSLKILACGKPDSGISQYFEMYQQTKTGTGAKICLGTSCIQEEGYVKSQNFPICINDTPSNVTNSTNTTKPPVNDTCTSTVQNAPISCNGQITQDVFKGCRTISCTSGANMLSVLACDKPDSINAQYFEMYQQARTGSSVRICIGSTCIQTEGYVKSGNFGICSQSVLLSAPTWIEPSDGLTGVTPDYFHINVLQPVNINDVANGDFEVWNNALTERIWAAINNSDPIKFHTHTPDGIFQGSLAGKSALLFSTTYKVRARFRDINGAYTPWSTWRTFTTGAQFNATGSSLAWTAVPGFKVERFATGLDLPVHIAFAPPLYGAYPVNQQPYMYVTELYGKVKVIYRDGSQSVYASNLLNFDPFGSITGGGQMGVIGLYVDNITGDLFVGMTYVTNGKIKNKVMRFTTTDDGRNYTSSKVLIDNLPSAPSHQVEDITKGPDGKLYVGLGEGDNSNNAQDDNILAGKIIRMNLDGTGVETYAKGFRNPFGQDWRPGFNTLYSTDNSPDSNDRVLKIEQGGNYGWCCDISKHIAYVNVSPVDVEFNKGGTGFPASLTGKMYVAIGGPIYQKGPDNGKHIIEYTLNNSGEVASARQFVWYTGTGYGTPIGLDFGPDGLYFTDIYGEPGFVGIGKTEGNIYRIVQGTPNPINETGPFRAGISVIPWYPKNTGNGIEYIFECQGIDGSGSYKYDYAFGDGQSQFNIDSNRIGPHVYPYSNHNYPVSCTVHDQQSGKQVSANMVVNPSDFIFG